MPYALDRGRPHATDNLCYTLPAEHTLLETDGHPYLSDHDQGATVLRTLPITYLEHCSCDLCGTEEDGVLVPQHHPSTTQRLRQLLRLPWRGCCTAARAGHRLRAADCAQDYRREGGGNELRRKVSMQSQLQSLVSV